MAPVLIAPSTSPLAVRAARVLSAPMRNQPVSLMLIAVVGMVVAGVADIISVLTYVGAVGMNTGFYSPSDVDWAAVHHLQFESLMWMLVTSIVLVVAGSYLVHLPRRLWFVIAMCYRASICQVPDAIVLPYLTLIGHWLDSMHVVVADEVRRHLDPVWVVMADYYEIIAPDAHMGRYLAPCGAVLPPTRAAIAGKFQATGLDIAEVQIETLELIVRYAEADLALSNEDASAEAKFMH